jgi:hypothetical protein
MSWAQSLFPQDQDSPACAATTWHTDPAGVRAFLVVWGAGILVAVAGAIYHRRLVIKYGPDRRLDWALGLCGLMAVLGPPVLWVLGYFAIVANCGL